MFITFSSLFCFSSLRDSTVLLSLAKIASLMFFDCCPHEASKLGWTVAMISEASIPIVVARLRTELVYSSTFRSLLLFQVKRETKHKKRQFRDILLSLCLKYPDFSLNTSIIIIKSLLWYDMCPELYFDIIDMTWDEKGSKTVFHLKWFPFIYRPNSAQWIRIQFFECLNP